MRIRRTAVLRLNAEHTKNISVLSHAPDIRFFLQCKQMRLYEYTNVWYSPRFYHPLFTAGEGWQECLQPEAGVLHVEKVLEN